MTPVEELDMTLIEINQTLQEIAKLLAMVLFELKQLRREQAQS